MEEQENKIKGEIKMNIGKKIRNFRKDMRAISPVIATLLMIAIAVVASLVTYAWVMGYMNFQTAKTGKAIQIQSVSNITTVTGASGSVDTLTLYIQNVGDSPVTFNDQSIFVEGGQIAPNATLGSAGMTVAAGSTAKISVNYTPPGTNATYVPVTFTVDLKVTTTDGTFSTMTKTFP
jgi:flagellin-like protein